MLRCIFCGYCEEACPTQAVQLKDLCELAEYNRKDTIYTKEMMLVPDDRILNPPRRCAPPLPKQEGQELPIPLPPPASGGVPCSGGGGFRDNIL